MSLATERLGPYAAGLLRIVSGVLFFQHGAMKIFGWFGGLDGKGATAALASVAGVAGLLELLGALMAIGLLTRPVAFILAGEMAVAYFWKHQPTALWPIQNQGTLAALFAVVWLYFAAAGPGRLAMDNLLRRRAR